MNGLSAAAQATQNLIQLHKRFIANHHFTGLAAGGVDAYGKAQIIGQHGF